MSSEHSIHLGDKQIQGRVDSLPATVCTTISLIISGQDGQVGNQERFTLFVHEGRLLDVMLTFQKIVHDLGALLPSGGDCAGCIPGEANDLCPEHGFEAWAAEQQAQDAAVDAAKDGHRWG